MIIFRSESKRLPFRVTNSSKRALHVMTELACEEFVLQPGEILHGSASVKTLDDPIDPLGFEIYLEDDHVSLWCPHDSDFRIEKAESK